MGMHASPTCQMQFDAAHAEMIGQPGEGLARMFTMMNAERLDVALQGVGQAEVAGQRSRAYAAERRQGRDAQGHDSKGHPAAIATHPDVQRMLLTQRALCLGTRGMVYRTLVELELGRNPALVEFMTPLCKAFCTDAAVEAAQLAIQIHGGYGYLHEYRVEQILRDVRVTQIYEGTNGVQALALAGRALRLGQGEAFATEIAAAITLAMDAGHTTEAAALKSALTDWRTAADMLKTRPDPGFSATAFLRLSGLVALAATWARMLTRAGEAEDPAQIRQVAAFVFAWMLPETATLSRQCDYSPLGSSSR